LPSGNSLCGAPRSTRGPSVVRPTTGRGLHLVPVKLAPLAFSSNEQIYTLELNPEPDVHRWEDDGGHTIGT